LKRERDRVQKRQYHAADFHSSRAIPTHSAAQNAFAQHLVTQQLRNNSADIIMRPVPPSATYQSLTARRLKWPELISLDTVNGHG